MGINKENNAGGHCAACLSFTWLLKNTNPCRRCVSATPHNHAWMRPFPSSSAKALQQHACPLLLLLLPPIGALLPRVPAASYIVANSVFLVGIFSFAAILGESSRVTRPP